MKARTTPSGYPSRPWSGHLRSTCSRRIIKRRPASTWTRLRTARASTVFETVIRSVTGERIDAMLTLSAVRTIDGDLAGMSVIARDISARKRLEEQLEHQALHDSLTGLPRIGHCSVTAWTMPSRAGVARSPRSAGRRSACCSSISTTSRSSTTRSATRLATSCSSRWAIGSRRPSGRATRRLDSAATNSPSCSRTSPTRAKPRRGCQPDPRAPCHPVPARRPRRRHRRKHRHHARRQRQWHPGRIFSVSIFGITDPVFKVIYQMFQ